MSSPRCRFAGLVCCAAWALTAAAVCAEDAGTDGAARSPKPASVPLQPFFNAYCIRCHGPEKPKGERRLDAFPTALHSEDDLLASQDVLDQLTLGEMPPTDAPQPKDGERQAVIAELTARIAAYHAVQRATGRGTLLRRLNSREYRNTVRDLLHLNMTMFDPTAGFPRDQVEEHLDNIGATLVTSGYLLDRYLDAADALIDKAMRPRERPRVQTWTFRDHFRQQPEIDKVHEETNGFSHLTLYEVVGADKHEGAYGPLLAFKEGVPHDGIYEIRVRAEAVNRINPYDPEFLGMDPAEPFRMGVVAGAIRNGPLHKPQPVEPLLAEMELSDDSRWYTVRVWLDRGFTPRFTFRNGLMDVRNLWGRVLKKYPDLFPKPRRPGIVEARLTAIKYGMLPQIHIHEVEIQGPLLEQWPTAAQRALLGDEAETILASRSMSDDQMRSRLSIFASRADRRPALPAEVDRLMQLVRVRRDAGAEPLEAFEDALKAVLCSPAFLYLDEPAEKGRLTDYALASRLSYFLWSSLPDEQLLALAARGELDQPETLAAQVERMLADSRSKAFVDGFLESCLTLRDLGSMPPDRAKFSAFYRYDLDSAMRQETRLFARCLLDENRNVAEFLDSDFTFVNEPLARLYEIPGVDGPEFQRVNLTDPRRGGLFGQASVLTVTANGIDTSPVVRGVWLLENILGTPPSPPPADVEPLDPDVRGTTTIREQLEKHRDNPACNDCHRKIDPLGFALENFDPIGAWRESYGRGRPVDSAGTLPDGRSFAGVAGLKEVLLEQKTLFGRALATRLLEYATGRRSEPADRPEIDRILGELEARGGGFRDLVKLVATSEPFLSP